MIESTDGAVDNILGNLSGGRPWLRPRVQALLLPRQLSLLQEEKKACGTGTAVHVAQAFVAAAAVAAAVLPARRWKRAAASTPRSLVPVRSRCPISQHRHIPTGHQRFRTPEATARRKDTHTYYNTFFSLDKKRKCAFISATFARAQYIPHMGSCL